MSTIIDADQIEQIDLRQQANYWRAQHARIAEREIILKKKVQELTEAICQRDAIITRQTQQIDALKAELICLKQQVFGRKTEQTENTSSDEQDRGSHIFNSSTDFPEKKGNRGQQEKTKGHGRKCRTNLPFVEQTHELLQEKCRCPKCGKPFLVLPGTEDSEEIEWEVILRRRIHKRTRYIPTCDCRVVPGIVTAPPPAKLIPKGMFAVSFWVRLIIEKFLFLKTTLPYPKGTYIGRTLCLSRNYYWRTQKDWRASPASVYANSGA